MRFHPLALPGPATRANRTDRGHPAAVPRPSAGNPNVSAYRLETIYRSGQHLLTLINDILDSSKIEAGRVNLSASEFELRDFSLDVLEMLKARVDAKGLHLGSEI